METATAAAMAMLTGPIPNKEKVRDLVIDNELGVMCEAGTLTYSRRAMVGCDIY